MAPDVSRESRQILGAMAIIHDCPKMRNLMNLESVITDKVTHDVHLLITGFDITEIGSFSLKCNYF